MTTSYTFYKENSLKKEREKTQSSNQNWKKSRSYNRHDFGYSKNSSDGRYSQNTTRRRRLRRHRSRYLNNRKWRSGGGEGMGKSRGKSRCREPNARAAAEGNRSPNPPSRRC